ncbi:hypothetical protein Tco_0138707 [Tanacetum coccineum]
MFVDFRTKLVKGSSKRAGEELEQESTKKQKVDEDKDIPDEEEVAIDAVPLANKVFSQMLKSFTREDLEDLYKLVKAKYGSTRPMKDLDLVLWNDLKTMFEPHVEDEIWKLQKRYKFLSWKLFDSCGVHCLSLQSGMIYMLVEKRYPLTPPTITDMLNKKLQERIVGIKSFLNTASIIAALIDVNTASVKLLLLVQRLLEYKVNVAEGVNGASEEVSTAELVSTAYVISFKEFDLLKWDQNGSFAEADLPVLEPLVGALPLGVSLVVDGFLEDSDSLVLLLFVFLPWFGLAGGSSSSSSLSSSLLLY